MRYDDYQSLVKRFKKTSRSNRFSFLERRFKRLKKRGHPRSYIKIRKNRLNKPILFDFNPFLEYSRKSEKWKVYFNVWYSLAYYMRKQLMLWSSLKAWKFFHYKKGIKKTFGLNPRWYKLMYFFYEYRFIKSFYNVCFALYSDCVSRSRNRRLRKFIKKYMKSLRWEVSRFIRKQRKYKHKKSKLKKVRSSFSRKKRMSQKILWKSTYKKWWKFQGVRSEDRLNMYRQMIKTYSRLRKGLRPRRMAKWLQNSPNFYFYRRGLKKGKGSVEFRKISRVSFKKLVRSRTLKGFYKLNVKHLSRFTQSELHKFAKYYQSQHGLGPKKRSSKSRIVSRQVFLQKNVIYSLGLGQTINVSKINPSLRYGVLSLIDLTNRGNYQSCVSVIQAMKSLMKRDVSYSSVATLVNRVSKVLNGRFGKLNKKRKRLNKFNMLRNRKTALSKISKYMKGRPALIPLLSKFIVAYKKKLVVDFYKYKQIKSQCNDYERDKFKSILRRRIRKLRSYKRKLRKLIRAMTRAKKLGGTLKSWFILRLTSKYRRILVRMRKYMTGVLPDIKGTVDVRALSLVFNNYFFYYILLYLVQTHYFFNSYMKEYIMHLLILFSYMCKSNFASRIGRFESVSHQMLGEHKIFTHFLKYENA